MLNKKLKKDLIKDITFKTGLSSNVAKKIFNDLVNILIQNIKKGSLVLKNVGSFKIIEKKEVIGVVCISGKLKSYPTKAFATKVLNNHGFTVKSSLTKDCTHLINESGIESAKTQTARDRGVIIISNIKHLIGEN